MRTSPVPAVEAPSVHRRVFLQWLAVYPSITVANLLVGPFVKPWPVAVRMLVITLMVVPATGYVLVPRLLEADARLTRAWRRRHAPR
ncbi:hypothetical protein [Catenulispora subtropica]|uniref:hypothetical protein n=1 Tax=Catenulispora subtropica TaxID=450798 RepID=UPI0031DFB0A7